MISEEARALWTCALGSDLELKHQLLLLSSASQNECLLAISSSHIVLAPVLVHLALSFVSDDEVTGVTTHSIVDIDCKVGHLTSQIKVL